MIVEKQAQSSLYFLMQTMAVICVFTLKNMFLCKKSNFSIVHSMVVTMFQIEKGDEDISFCSKVLFAPFVYMFVSSMFYLKAFSYCII